MPPRVVFTAVAITVLLVLLSSCPTRADAGETVTYIPPVDAPIVDPFRPPPTRYGSGNRGLEYATADGTAVRAAADGVVAFAGDVAGALHVTLSHPDGLRTSYSFLAEVAVLRGQRVRRGDVVGTADRRLHFGARDLDDNYLDPESLWSGASRARARLVPGVDEGAAPLASAERAALLSLLLDRGARWVGDRAEVARLVMHYAVELRPEVRLARTARTIARLRAQQRFCTPADEAPAPPSSRRIAILVGGLGSTATHAAVDDVDTTALGFAENDVLRFSYAGGRVPDATDNPRFGSVPATAYGAADSNGDLELAAAQLGELLRLVGTAQPGVPIDVIAHSQGGVVARLAIAQEASVQRLPASVSTLVTIGTPHDGADLATAAAALGRPVDLMPEAVVRAVSGQDPSAISVRQLNEVSDFIDELDELVLPPALRRVSIAARGDLVVAVPRTVEDQWPSAVVALGGLDAHDRLPGAEATTREIALALAGRPPTCASTEETVTDAISGETVSLATDLIAASMLAKAALLG